MNEQLSKFLKTLSPTERDAYFKHIKNKFHSTKPRCHMEQVDPEKLINLAKIFGANFFINKIFQKTKNFRFNNENTIKIKQHKTPVGPVALLEITNDLEFNRFLEQILNSSNAKANQGACLIFGKKISLIIISHKPYSNVNESFFNLSRQNWLNLSKKIRIEHETTHYCTKQLYGYAENNLHDELIADFIAISKTMGQFKANWFLKFISNKNSFKKCRFEIYVDKLPAKTKQALFLTTKICAKFMETWSKSKECTLKTTLEQIKFLCNFGISNMTNYP